MTIVHSTTLNKYGIQSNRFFQTFYLSFLIYTDKVRKEKTFGGNLKT